MKESHVFDPKHVAVLESEDRKTWQNPEKILELLKLKPDYVAADLGCGSGFFAVPLSRRVKKVYGIDFQKEMLEFLEQKIQEQNIEKIFTNKMVELFDTELPQIKDKNKKRLAEISSKIGSYSIESIENIIKIPRIIHSILTRRGYRYRAQKIADGPVNKLVILRRWQSYNPSVPRPDRENIPGGGYFLLWEGKGINRSRI